MSHFFASNPASRLCSSPLCASPSNKNDATGFRSQNESKVRRKHSPSADRQNFLDRSLNKAIRAAKHMESTSGHMSRSLRFGLHHQQLLLTPLMAQLSQRPTSNWCPKELKVQRFSVVIIKAFLTGARRIRWYTVKFHTATLRISFITVWIS